MSDFLFAVFPGIPQTGNRAALIDVTSAGFTVTDGVLSNLVNGATGNNNTDSMGWNGATAAGAEIVFDFGNVRPTITSAQWLQSTTAGHGTWQWQGSHDGTSWTNIGSTFTLGGATSSTHTQLNGNTTSYRYYKLLGISGTRSGAPWLQEINFTYTHLDFTFDVPAGIDEVDVLLVAGGGGGGLSTSGSSLSGGGGAGGVKLVEGYAVTPEGQVTGTIGLGGLGGQVTGSLPAANGGNTTFGTETALGGGGGGHSGVAPASGGSGGGSGSADAGGSGTSGQGYEGGDRLSTAVNARAGGGGGASQPGVDGNTGAGGHGGDGIELEDIGFEGAIALGAPAALGGGGGGGSYTNSSILSPAGEGGLGGGGNGGQGSQSGSQTGFPGAAITGGGGGGAGSGAGFSAARNGGNGGSGIVIVRYSFPSSISSDITFDYELLETVVFTSDLVVDYEIEPVWSSSIAFRYEINDGFIGDLTIDYALVSQLESDLEVDYRIAELFEADAEFDYSLVASMSSDLTIDYVIFEPKETRLTQLPILTLDLSSQPVRLTQLPILAVAISEQNTRLTQLPIKVPTIPRPVPLPAPMIPRAPVTEVWSYLTVVHAARGSKEQRSRLRETPRYSVRYTSMLTDEVKRREAYDILYKYQGKVFPYPMFHHFSRIIEPSFEGETRLFFNPAATDLRVGERLAVFDVYSMEVVTYGIAELHLDGATLDVELDRDITEACVVCPVIDCRMPTPHSLSMSTDVGSMSMRIESVYDRTFQRLPFSGLLTMLDGLPVITQRFLDGDEEFLDRNIQWRDNGTSVPSPNTHWRGAFSSGDRQWVFDRETGMDYWRAFADYTKGRQKPFYLSTFWDDLPLAAEPAPGATSLLTSNIQADEYINQRNCRHIRIESDAGVIYRRINYRILNYDEEGHPITVTLLLSASIGGTAASARIKRISFVNLCRLDTDDITIEHHTGHSLIGFSIRTINE